MRIGFIESAVSYSSSRVCGKARMATSQGGGLKSRPTMSGRKTEIVCVCVCFLCFFRKSENVEGRKRGVKQGQ